MELTERMLSDLRDCRAFLAHYLASDVVHVPALDGRGHEVSGGGWAAVRIPDWAVRQKIAWLDETIEALTPVDPADIPVLQPITRKTRQVSCMAICQTRPSIMCGREYGHTGDHYSDDAITKDGTWWPTSLCMAQHPEHRAFLCELPAGHDGSHTAVDHDLAGARLVWENTYA